MVEAEGFEPHPLLPKFTCLPVQAWTQTQGASAVPDVNPGTSLDKRNEGNPAYRSPEAQMPIGDASAGSRTFSTNCAGCHGLDGRGRTGASGRSARSRGEHSAYWALNYAEGLRDEAFAQGMHALRDYRACVVEPVSYLENVLGGELHPAG